jgi:zinc and cadmium transporter
MLDKILLSIFIVSLISFIGVFTLSLSNKLLKKSLLFLVSFAAGALFGDVFIHLLPELTEKIGFNLTVTFSLLSGILIFFILEKFLHWHHCHDNECEVHNKPLAFMNLAGDALHNFIDGILIAGSYLVSIPLGIATTVAVIFHEIPQEIGDFGVLLHSGFSKAKALGFNFLISLTAFLGAIFTFFIGPLIENFTSFIIPITAGGFLYIAGSDLIPELHKETKISSSLLQFLGLILGIFVMFLLTFLE